VGQKLGDTGGTWDEEVVATEQVATARVDTRSQIPETSSIKVIENGTRN